MLFRSVKNLCAFLILAASPVATAHASHVGFRLEVTVPVVCAIMDARVDPAQQREIVLVTNCNAERFAISLAGDLSAIAVEEAGVQSGAIIANGNRLTITGALPGSNLIRVQFQDDLSTVRGGSFSIQPA